MNGFFTALQEILVISEISAGKSVPWGSGARQGTSVRSLGAQGGFGIGCQSSQDADIMPVGNGCGTLASQLVNS
jgi:hypothetical protein